MKKIVLITIILLLPGISSAIEYACSDNSQIVSNSEEISEGRVKSIFSLPIGVCGASDNSYYNWVDSTLFLDASTAKSISVKSTYLLTIRLLVLKRV